MLRFLERVPDVLVQRCPRGEVGSVGLDDLVRSFGCEFLRDLEFQTVNFLLVSFAALGSQAVKLSDKVLVGFLCHHEFVELHFRLARQVQSLVLAVKAVENLVGSPPGPEL